MSALWPSWSCNAFTRFQTPISDAVLKAVSVFEGSEVAAGCTLKRSTSDIGIDHVGIRHPAGLWAPSATRP